MYFLSSLALNSSLLLLPLSPALLVPFSSFSHYPQHFYTLSLFSSAALSTFLPPSEFISSDAISSLFPALSVNLPLLLIFLFLPLLCLLSLSTTLYTPLRLPTPPPQTYLRLNSWTSIYQKTRAFCSMLFTVPCTGGFSGFKNLTKNLRNKKTRVYS